MVPTGITYHTYPSACWAEYEGHPNWYFSLIAIDPTPYRYNYSSLQLISMQQVMVIGSFRT